MSVMPYVPPLVLGEHSASIGNWVEKTIVLFLFQDGTQTMTAGIGVQHKPSAKIGVGQDRWGGQELFQASRQALDHMYSTSFLIRWYTGAGRLL